MATSPESTIEPPPQTSEATGDKPADKAAEEKAAEDKAQKEEAEERARIGMPDDVERSTSPPAAKVKAPFWKNWINPTERKVEDPPRPLDPLDREKNLSKDEDIQELLDSVLNFEFERNMRNKRMRELYGQNLIGRWKAFLAGEGRWELQTDANGQQRMELIGGDFTYTRAPDPTRGNLEVGTLRHDWRNEAQRKTASVLLRSGRTLAIGSAFAAFTGGIGATFLPALLGSTLARGGFEGVRAGASKERKLRETIEISRIAYFEKCRILASRVGPKYDPAITTDSEEDYNARRSDNIKSLVDYVHTWEDLGVDAQYDEEGNAIVVNEVRGEPLPVGTDISDTRRQGGPAGPAFISGTELIQPSLVSPDAKKVRELEDDLAENKRKWDKWEEGTALMGGLAGGALAIIHGWNSWIGDIYQGYQTQLQNGEAVKLDVNGDLKGHLVQKVEGLKDQFVYHLRGIGEQLGALKQGTDVVDVTSQIGEVGRFGSHVLGETAARINDAVYQKSVIEAIGQIGKVLVTFGGSYWLGENARRGNEKNTTQYRKDLVHDLEQWRKRMQPDTSFDQLAEWAEANNKIFPQPGETWVRKNKDDNFYRIKIRAVSEASCDASVQSYDPNNDYNEVVVMPLRVIMEEFTKEVKLNDTSENKDDIGKGPTDSGNGGGDGGGGDRKEPTEKKNIILYKEGEKSKEIELKDGLIFQDPEPDKRNSGYWQIEILADGKIKAKPFGLKKNSTKIQYYSGDKVVTFNDIKELQGWINERGIYFNAPNMDRFKKAAEEKSKKKS